MPKIYIQNMKPFIYVPLPQMPYLNMPNNNNNNIVNTIHNNINTMIINNNNNNNLNP